MSLPVVITLGCRVNAFEAEAVRRHAAAAGLADAVIVNTCAVTGEAVRQARQSIRRARRERPDARIIVTGCAAQIEPERFAAMPEVDQVIGNPDKLRANTFVRIAGGASARVVTTDAAAAAVSDGLGDAVAAQVADIKARSWVVVQNGCDHSCTFCTIPLGRGPSRSVPAADVVLQVRRLVEAGCPEVVLAGVDLTAWGRDLAGGEALGDLAVRVLREVPELKRLRLSSIDQAEADDTLMRAIAEEERLMPHLHLSLQAGDDLILKRMKRRHSRAQAIAFCDRLRRLRPDIVLGADLIAGFPTETEAQFANTLALVEDCGLTFLHVFPFSGRAGTPAARMPQVARDVVGRRAAELRSRGAAMHERWLDAKVGGVETVFIENGCRGRTAQFAEVDVAGLTQSAKPGAAVRAAVRGRSGSRLEAEVIR